MDRRGVAVGAQPTVGRGGRTLIAVVPTVFLGYFFLYPLISILTTSFTTDGSLDLSAFGDVLTRPTLRGTAFFTIWQATVSTLLTVLAGLPAAYVFARFRFRGRSLFRAAVTIPFVLPTVVVGTAFLALIGPNGALGVDLSRTIWAILAAHVFYNYAIVVRTVGTLWEQLDPRLEEAARALGASRWQTFKEVSLPLLRPAIAAASSLVFLFTFTSFGVILILGGLEFRTLEVEIWRQTTSFLNLDVAAALAVLQLVGVAGILVAYARYQQRRAIEQPLKPPGLTARAPTTLTERGLVAATLGGTAVLLGAPIAVLVGRSFRTPVGWGLDHYGSLAEGGASALFVTPTEAISNSLAFGTVATVLAVTVGLMAAAVVAYRKGRLSRGFDTFLMLPLGTSAVTIGFGFLIALDQPIDLRASAWLIPIAHALVAIPLVVRTAVPVMRSVQTRLREAAAVLGASPAQAWREVDLPLIGRAAAVGAGFALAVSLGEFGATSFIVRPDSPTLPIAIFRLLSQPGAANFGQAMAMSTFLVILTGAAILIIDRYRVGSEF
ncbi:MAG: ABC transporter permease [Acidimicrobiia bacterium]